MGGFFLITAMTYREAPVIRPRGGGKPRPVRKPINELMKNYDFHVRVASSPWGGAALCQSTRGMPITSIIYCHLVLINKSKYGK